MIDGFLALFLSMIGYFLLLILVRLAKIGKKERCENCNNCCPDCKSALERIKRKYVDHFIHNVTLRFFDARRYICSNCGWEGLRWEERFQERV